MRGWRAWSAPASFGRARASRRGRCFPAHRPRRKRARRRSPPCWTSAAKGVEGAVKFWDASSLVPLLVAEPTTRTVQALAVRDPDMLVWWGSRVECTSALARLERETALDGRQARAAYDRLD